MYLGPLNNLQGEPINTGAPKEGEVILFTNCSFTTFNSAGFITYETEYKKEVSCVICDQITAFYLIHTVYIPRLDGDPFICRGCQDNLPQYSLFIRLLKWLVN
jgi:hypothetical protein